MIQPCSSSKVGPRGPRGPTGVTGPTGPGAPAGGASAIHVYSTDDQDIATNGRVGFSLSTARTIGTGLFYDAGFSQVQVAAGGAGHYELTYGISKEIGSLTTGFPAMGVHVNTILDASTLFAPTALVAGGGVGSFDFTFLSTIKTLLSLSVGDVVDVRNIGTDTAHLRSGPNPAEIKAFLTLIRISL